MSQTSDEPIYDESLVPVYTLPDPLICLDGSPIYTPEDWWQKRRPEILHLFTQEMYGFAPDRPEIMEFHQRESQTGVLGGLAERKQVEISLQNGGKNTALDLLLYLPAARSGPVPVFLSLNFSGNHTIHADPGILLARSWLPDWPEVVDHQATEAARGMGASRWPVETILERGYGLATMYYGDIDPDYDDGFENGVHALFPG